MGIRWGNNIWNNHETHKNKYKVLSTDDDEYYKDKKDLTKLAGGKKKER